MMHRYIHRDKAQRSPPSHRTHSLFVYYLLRSYDLSLEPDLEAFTFTGVVDITFSIDKSKITDENAKTITLHARELCFSQASCSSGTTSKEAGAASPSISTANEIHQNVKEKTVKFVFDTTLTEIAGDGDSLKLKVEYTGFLNNQMAGFYRSHYTDIDGNKKVMASTQFESLDARRALPCVDEPSAKAVFAVTLTIPSNLHCFSNMPVSSKVSVSRTKTKYSFLDSPRMSTYLLAFCVGEFDSVQAATKSGVMVQIYTPPGKSSSGTFALDAAVRVLDAFDEFFGTPYPLPKLDMVAISEFAMGKYDETGIHHSCMRLVWFAFGLFNSHENSVRLFRYVPPSLNRCTRCHGELGLGYVS